MQRVAGVCSSECCRAIEIRHRRGPFRHPGVRQHAPEPRSARKQEVHAISQPAQHNRGHPGVPGRWTQASLLACVQIAASRGNALAGRTGALMHVSRGRALGPAGLRGALVLLACCAVALQGRRAAGQFVGIDFNSPARLVFGATQLAEALLDQAISRVVIHGAPWDTRFRSGAHALCSFLGGQMVCTYLQRWWVSVFGSILPRVNFCSNGPHEACNGV